MKPTETYFKTNDELNKLDSNNPKWSNGVLENPKWAKLLCKYHNTLFLLTRNENYLAFVCVTYKGNNNFNNANIKSVFTPTIWYVGNFVTEIYEATKTSYDKYSKTFMSKSIPYNAKYFKHILLNKYICEMKHNFGVCFTRNNNSKVSYSTNKIVNKTIKNIVEDMAISFISNYTFPIIDYTVDETIKDSSINSIIKKAYTLEYEI